MDPDLHKYAVDAPRDGIRALGRPQPAEFSMDMAFDDHRVPASRAVQQALAKNSEDIRKVHTEVNRLRERIRSLELDREMLQIAFAFLSVDVDQ